MNNGTSYSSTYSSSSGAGAGSSTANLTDAVVDTMVRWPMRMTGAAVDMMIRGAQSMTGSSRGAGSNGYSASYESANTSSNPSAGSSNKSNSGWTSLFSNQTSGTFDQDLSGDDLKYVIWSIVFTKPGCECILQKQQEELVNYSADSSTYAAVKIAKFLDSARHGHSDRPETWSEKGYPGDSSKPKSSRKETSSVVATPGSTSYSSSSSTSERGSSEQEKGWRIPPEDQKYICFLYRVDRRLPKQQDEVTRVERVTVERGTRVV
jgi:hypothetical protein